MYMNIRKNKKGNLSVIEVLLVLFTFVIILYVFVIAINESRSIAIDQKEIKTQIIISKLLNSECLSNSYARVNEEIYSEERVLEECIPNSDESLYLRTFLSDLDRKNAVTSNIRYLHSEEIFQQKRNLCSFSNNKENSNILCTQMEYPIIYESLNGDEKPKLLNIQIIAFS
jgi:competence protein ComGC